MAGKTRILLALFLLSVTSVPAVEPFRVFKTPQGHSLEGRAIGYEGKIFHIQIRDGSLRGVSLDQLVKEDKIYLIQAVQQGKIKPRKASSGKTDEQPKPESQTKEKVDDSRSSPPPAPPKPKLRPGSFFSYNPVAIGEDPALADSTSTGGSTPQEGEPIDFTKHILPILEDRCNNCHGAPHEKNGRTINPKAGLRLDSYEWVIKGNDSGAIVKAGNLEESLIYEVLNLPPDDDLFMPPKGGALPAEQIDIFKRWITEGAKSSNGDGSSTASGSMPGPNEPIDFEKHLMPMIEESCIDCHGAPYVNNGRTIPPKAGLRLDSHEAIIKGNLDGPIVSPGSLEESTIYQVITLDPDDAEIMPPKGDPWNEEQIAILKRWILEGAKPRPGAASLAPDKAKPTVSNQGTVKPVSKFDVIGKKVRPASKPQLEAAMKSGALVTPLSEKHSLVRVEFASAAYQTTDSDLSLFSNLKNNISHLDLSKSKITDQALGIVKGYNNLTWLSLRNTGVGDRGLASLEKMEQLTYLNLVGTKVTDTGLNALASINTLEEVYLWNSKVSKKGVENLKKSLPETKIIY